MPLNAEVMSVLLRMRILIRNEFATTLSLQDHDIVEKCCSYARKSRQPDLVQMGQYVRTLVPDPAAVSVPTVMAVPAPAIVAPAPQMSPVATPKPAVVQQTPRILSPAPAPKAVPTVTPATAATPTTDFLEFLLSGRLGRPMRLLYPGLPMVVIDKPLQRCFLSSPLKDLAPLKDVDVQALRLEAVSEVSLARYAQQHESISLEAFLWFCGTTFSCGVLLPSLAARQGFHLRHWPDGGKLSMTHQHRRMAALLIQKPYTCESLIATAAVTQEEATAFLNAAFLCGWLRDEAPAPSPAPVPVTAPPPTSDQSPRGIIGRIRARLGLSR